MLRKTLIVSRIDCRFPAQMQLACANRRTDRDARPPPLVLALYIANMQYTQARLIAHAKEVRDARRLDAFEQDIEEWSAS